MNKEKLYQEFDKLQNELINKVGINKVARFQAILELLICEEFGPIEELQKASKVILSFGRPFK